MLRSRIIPSLLIHKKGLVKTENFSNPKYVGDPINAVKIFNEKEVDELIVLDIDKSIDNTPPDFSLIQKLANECRMPFCYGGGIKNLEDAVKIISMGVEKVALSSGAIHNPNLCIDLANVIGAQSIVVVLDVKKKSFRKGYSVFTHNGKKKSKIKFEDLLRQFNEFPVGEIVINSIDLDGTMQGYDLNLVEYVRSIIDVPLTILGGASSLDDIGSLIEKYRVIGAAAGSLFVFKGKFKAVLINYPNREQREPLYNIE